jgi:acyl-CoA synthetase (AMP-forming)/AMP-acid ligase II
VTSSARPAAVAPPPIVFRGRTWSGAEVGELARCWRAALDAREPEPATAPIAMVMVNQPEAVALFFALSAGRAPVILLPPEPRSWRTDPPVPAGTRLVLPSSLARLVPEAERAGLRVILLPSPDERPTGPEVDFMSCPGLVFLTSGSTGLPRPVYRRAETLLAASTALTAAIGFPPRGGVIAALPLDRSYGMNTCLMAATVLGRPLGLLERFDHNALLALFATGEYHLWAGSPVMADVLGRAPGASTHPAPPMCIFAGRLPAPVCDAFRTRFGVELRQVYGTTETLTVTADLGPHPVRSDTAGRPLPGVTVRVGERPGRPLPPEALGRVWISSPWLMVGYGYTADDARDNCVDGWWPSPDGGYFDESGALMLSGRLDDCIRTGAGQLVNPGQVAAVVESVPGVTDAAVVPVEAAAGTALGVLVQCAPDLDGNDVRRALAQALPPWAQPRALKLVRALPRLPSGRTDRRACIQILQRAVRDIGP